MVINIHTFIRAVVESQAYQVYDLIEAMKQDAQMEQGTLKVDGGASVNNFLVQFQADILQQEILRPKCTETTALGAAYLAGLAVGYWKDKEEIKRNWKSDKKFQAFMEENHRKSLLKGWRRAVKCVLYWAREEDDEDEI